MQINRFIYYINSFLIILFVFLADYITKQAVEGSPFVTYNTGIGFSLLRNYPLFIAGATSVIILIILGIAIYVKDYYLGVPLCLIVGGGLGNLNDRFQQAPYFGKGAVVDFINYGFFIGNIADIFVVLGIIVFVIDYFYVIKYRGAKSKSKN
ncbi:MAG: signal peptidase II [Bifidobacteriaceae bacterium]|jgi:lipoprotein signal peptidase|nr:signal peptidase II [Bifidobacteriaceae bacterium]